MQNKLYIYGKSKYEKVISVIDYWIGKILDNVDLENTLITLPADHGDYIPVIELDRKKL